MEFWRTLHHINTSWFILTTGVWQIEATELHDVYKQHNFWSAFSGMLFLNPIINCSTFCRLQTAWATVHRKNWLRKLKKILIFLQEQSHRPYISLTIKNKQTYKCLVDELSRLPTFEMCSGLLITVRLLAKVQELRRCLQMPDKYLPNFDLIAMSEAAICKYSVENN